MDWDTPLEYPEDPRNYTVHSLKSHLNYDMTEGEYQERLKAYEHQQSYYFYKEAYEEQQSKEAEARAEKLRIESLKDLEEKSRKIGMRTYMYVGVNAYDTNAYANAYANANTDYKIEFRFLEKDLNGLYILYAEFIKAEEIEEAIKKGYNEGYDYHKCRNEYVINDITKPYTEYPEEYIEYNMKTKTIDLSLVVVYCKMSEEFIEKHYDILYCDNLFKFQKLSENFLNKHLGNILFVECFIYQNVSYEFIKKHFFEQIEKTKIKIVLDEMHKNYDKLSDGVKQFLEEFFPTKKEEAMKDFHIDY